MSALIMRPDAAHYRPLRRVHDAIRALHWLPALMLLLSASALSAVEAPSRPTLQRNSFLLSSAGFRVQLANTPEGQKALRALPPQHFVVQGVGDAQRYYYAEPQHCVCVFVGTRQAYDSYRRIIEQPVRASDNPSPDYKTQAGVLLDGQPPRQSTKGDPTTLADYLHTLPLPNSHSANIGY
jgi:hypothetical protein